jgi:sec-independent protein translocase protein TatB
MFDIAWSEFLVVAVVALVVVGPRDLPALLRTVGKTVASLRRMAGEFQSQFNEAMREAELDDLKREVTGLKDQASKLVGPNPLQIARDELKSAWDDKPASAPSALSGETPKTDPEADIPSAFAPPPAIEAPAEPPIPTEADFAPTPEAEPAPKRARKGAAKANGAAKPDAAKPDDETAEPPPGAAA